MLVLLLMRSQNILLELWPSWEQAGLYPCLFTPNSTQMRQPLPLRNPLQTLARPKQKPLMKLPHLRFHALSFQVCLANRFNQKEYQSAATAIRFYGLKLTHAHTHTHIHHPSAPKSRKQENINILVCQSVLCSPILSIGSARGAGQLNREIGRIRSYFTADLLIAFFFFYFYDAQRIIYTTLFPTSANFIFFSCASISSLSVSSYSQVITI